MAIMANAVPKLPAQKITSVKDTGIRGFLKWFQQVQPDIYKKIAPNLPKQIPQAFSDYTNGGWRVAGLSRDDAVKKLRSMRVGLGDTDMLDPITVEASYSGVSDFSDAISPLSFDYNDASFSPVSIDTSTAANNGPNYSGLGTALSSIISAASGAYLTANQSNIQNQVVQTQLQRAAAGLPPLPTSLTSLGVPQASIGATLPSGTMLLLLAGIGGLMFLSKK